MGAPSPPDDVCGHAFPNCEASLIALEVSVIGTGALKRRLPTGGWAKGIPKNVSVPFGVASPRKVPVFNGTSTVCSGGESPTTKQVPYNKIFNLPKARRRFSIMAASSFN